MFRYRILCASCALFAPVAVATAQTVDDETAIAAVGASTPLVIGAADAEQACMSPKSLTVTFTRRDGYTIPSLPVGSTDVDVHVYWVNGDDCWRSDFPSSSPDRFALDSLSGTVETDFIPLVFPTDLGLTFDQEDFLTYLAATGSDVCTTLGTPVTSRVRRLCVAIDWDEDDKPTQPSVTGTGDFVGGVNFEFDTAPPPAPTLSFDALDGQVIATTSFSGTGETGDVVRWEVRMREAQDDDAECDTWSASELVVQRTITAGSAGGFEITNLENGVAYEGCVRAVDNAGNASPYSNVATATPIDECDFVECYPGNFPHGYCGAVGGGGAWGLVAGLLAMRLRRRRR